MYYDETIEVNFDLPDYIKEYIENLIKARKEKRLDVDCEESELLSNINRAFYDGYITWDQGMVLRRKYLWWD